MQLTDNEKCPCYISFWGCFRVWVLLKSVEKKVRFIQHWSRLRYGCSRRWPGCRLPAASCFHVGTWQSQHLSLRQLSENWAGFYPDRNYVCLGLCSQGSLIFVLTWKEGWTKGEIFLQISAQGMRFEKYVPFLELMTQSRQCQSPAGYSVILTALVCKDSLKS